MKRSKLLTRYDETNGCNKELVSFLILPRLEITGRASTLRSRTKVKVLKRDTFARHKRRINRMP